MRPIAAIKLIEAWERFRAAAKQSGGNMGKLATPTVAFATTIAAIFHPQIQDFITTHPTLAVIVGGIATIAATFAPQPHK